MRNTLAGQMGGAVAASAFEAALGAARQGVSSGDTLVYRGVSLCGGAGSATS